MEPVDHVLPTRPPPEYFQVKVTPGLATVVQVKVRSRVSSAGVLDGFVSWTLSTSGNNGKSCKYYNIIIIIIYLYSAIIHV